MIPPEDAPWSPDPAHSHTPDAARGNSASALQQELQRVRAELEQSQAVLAKACEQIAALERTLRTKNEELREATDAFARVESAAAAKDQALVRLVHELRTPVNAIVLWTELLDSENGADEPDRLAHALAAIRQSAREQCEILERLFATARSFSPS